MDIFLSSAFAKYEIAFLGLNLIYIVFHLLHSLFHSYLKFRNFLGKSKKISPLPEEQTKISGE